jgi:glycosyltransferase involved in cell wall biosynthesis
MSCPTLSELPPSPPGKEGWPWTENSSTLALSKIDGSSWPRITIVTPSYNQGKYIEETIRSVLLQQYPNLEYIIIDGGSSDESIEIIKKYSKWITYWKSEPDKGQSDAINKGMKIGTGSIAGWINSDDMLYKDALNSFANSIEYSDNYIYIGDCYRHDVAGNVLIYHRAKINNITDLLNIKKVWKGKGYIVQPEVLFPRALFLKVGGLNINNHYVMDFELWGKLLLEGLRIKYTYIPFAYFRIHDAQKTKDEKRTTEILIKTAREIINIATVVTRREKKKLLWELRKYEAEIMYRDATFNANSNIDRLNAYFKICRTFNYRFLPPRTYLYIWLPWTRYFLSPHRSILRIKK